MILSRILMVLALAVLAYLVYITMTGSENFKADKKAPKGKQENFDTKVTQVAQVAQAETFNNNISRNANSGCSVNPQPQIEQLPKQESFVAESKEIVYEPAKQEAVPQNISYDEVPKVETFDNKQNIKYETFAGVSKIADVGGIADTVNGAAPFGGKPEMDEGDFAKVSYTGLVDGTPGDVIQIEGTDLLTAPLVDNMLYTNSIANTNRNASQDLRGDIPLQFNDTYTPFYSSVIYGAPLSEKQMTIGKI
jgi:hypothetical protein